MPAPDRTAARVSCLWRIPQTIVLCLGAALVIDCSAHAQIRSIDARPPQRDFGYYPGDLFTSTVVIDVGPDTVLDAASLPPAGPVSAAIDLRDISYSGARIAGGQRITINAEWQTFATPEEVSRVDIPGYQLVLDKGASRLTAAVAGFSIAVSPFRHDLQPVLDTSVLRPDHPVARIDVAPWRHMLFATAAVALLAALALAWSNGFLAWTNRGRAPFARAAWEIARHADDGRDSFLLLHRAFDEAAGKRVLADDLDHFLMAHPRFAGLRTDIERFFADSRRIFFDTGQASPSLPSLMRLSRALARAERR